MILKCKKCSLNEHCICIPDADECHIRKESYNKAIEDVIKLVDDDLTSDTGMDMYVERNLLCDKLEKLIN